MDESDLQNAIQILNLQQIFISSIVCLKLIKKLKRKLRRWWVKPYILPEIRNHLGAYTILCEFFKFNDHEEFQRHFKMTVETFESLHNLLANSLTKENCVRQPIPSTIRLAITIHYLGHGGSSQVYSSLYRVGKSTFYQIIADTCKEITAILIPLVLQLPNKQRWLQIANDFNKKWNFPNCLGALDGKHVKINRPPHGGSIFYNYKKFHSLVLMGISDAYCRFVWFTVGDAGSFSDASVWSNSSFYKKLCSNQLQIPDPVTLPNSNKCCPFVFIGDEIFQLETNVMKPFCRRLLHSEQERIYNYRLSRARFTIECAFGMLCSKWQILNSALRHNIETNKQIISSCICLHNFIIDNKQPLPNEYENVQQNAINMIHDSPVLIRHNFTQYFVHEGAVPWQDKYI